MSFTLIQRGQLLGDAKSMDRYVVPNYSVFVVKSKINFNVNSLYLVYSNNMESFLGGGKGSIS